MRIRKTYNGVVPNGKILNSYSTSQNDGYSCNYINELKPFVLWENSNPNSDMPDGTTINLESDDYDILEIYYKFTTTNNRMWSKRILKGYGGYLDIGVPYYSGGNHVANTFREFSRQSDTQYTLTQCYIYYQDTNTTTRENFLIPTKIIGYKL